MATGTEIIRPTTNFNAFWEAYAASLVNEEVEDPSSAADGTFAYANEADDNLGQQWVMPAPTTLTTVTSVRQYMRMGFYDRGASWDARNMQASSYINDVLQSANVIATSASGFAWFSCEWTGSWTPDDFSGTKARSRAHGGSIPPDYEFRMANIYWVLTGELAFTPSLQPVLRILGV